MTFPEKTTTKDLSGIPENQDFPAYSASMQNGNTVTNKSEFFSGQGTNSEASHDVVSHTMVVWGESHDTPALPGPATPASDLSVDEKGSGYSPVPRTWKEL
jgi:hypothetical protein